MASKKSDLEYLYAFHTKCDAHKQFRADVDGLFLTQFPGLSGPVLRLDNEHDRRTGPHKEENSIRYAAAISYMQQKRGENGQVKYPKLEAQWFRDYLAQRKGDHRKQLQRKSSNSKSDFKIDSQMDYSQRIYSPRLMRFFIFLCYFISFLFQISIPSWTDANQRIRSPVHRPLQPRPRCRSQPQLLYSCLQLCLLK